MSKLKLDWTKIIIGFLMAALAAFGISSFIRANNEEDKRIEAQNKIAEMSEIFQESEDTWSRLSQQKENLIEELREDNEDLANKIEDQDLQIHTLSTIVAKFDKIRIIVKRENVTQSPDEKDPERKRVTFSQTVDPIRVDGFTLTDPPEAELDVDFVRPLKLKTIVTQAEDGSWKTFISGDWPNLQIEQIDTTVNPRTRKDRSLPENISIGGSLSTSTTLDSLSGDLNLMYDFGDLQFGPKIGITNIDDKTRFLVGLQMQYFPWRQ